jgi:hypothetical protein
MLVRGLACLALAIAAAGCGGSAEKGDGAAATGSDGPGGTTSASTTHGGVGGASGPASTAVGAQSGTGGSAVTGSGGDAGSSGFSGSGGAASGGAASGSGGETTTGTGEAGEGGEGGSGGSPEVPGFDDFIIRSDAMGAYEGLTVYVAYDQNTTVGSRSENRSDVVTSGAFEVILYVDVDGDAVCDDDVDEAWWFFVSNLSNEGEPQIGEFDPDPDGMTIGLDEITCDQFESGLSG